ncbi:hypothetical protein L5515_005827 [Caenorhabditis briggsae]|uniref:Serpentine receptor class r-10 n=1 Tax=Caenorhabditis briggsae TaxID=6238 RepID=A0AAE9JK25_CAEBR|nr:hypothetical protein L5515_005827 [Caenorhabditis briggsae]
MLYLHVIQYFGFIGSQLANSLLIYLILTKARKLFGMYRFVMLGFAFFFLFYSWIEILTQPVIHIKSPVCIVFMDSSLKYFKPHILSHGEERLLFYLCVPCFLCFVAWFEFVYWGMANTVEKQLYMKSELAEIYNEDSESVAFIAVMYWSVGPDGQKKWKINDIGLLLACVVTIGGCFMTIVYCASRIYKKMKDSSGHMSGRTMELNRQLFITLTIQTILPLFMMYIPVGLATSLPIFEIHTGRIANFTAASLAVYPFLEPIVPMLCIKEFKNFILCRQKRKVASRTTFSSPVSGIHSSSTNAFL